MADLDQRRRTGTRVLVTGIGGFVGRHLAHELAAHGFEVIGWDRTVPDPPVPEAGAVYGVDILDETGVTRALDAAAPEACVHLAALASVPACRVAPVSAYAVNVMGTLHLLEAVRRSRSRVRLLVVSSAQIYAPQSADARIDESAPAEPGSVYGLTKLAADRAALHYAHDFGLNALTARPVNHIGPGQSPAYVIPAFAVGLAAIARGECAPVLRVGNLESTRDFLDVRDTVRGYRLLLERGIPGRAYHLASGRRVSVGAMLEELCRVAGMAPRIETDASRYRPTDHSPWLDTARILRDTGWTPSFNLEHTLADVYRDQMSRS